MLCTDKAPLSKGLLLVLNGLTVILTLLPKYQELLVYNLQAVTQQHQVQYGVSVCLSAGEELNQHSKQIFFYCTVVLNTSRHIILLGV